MYYINFIKRDWQQTAEDSFIRFKCPNFQSAFRFARIVLEQFSQQDSQVSWYKFRKTYSYVVHLIVFVHIEKYIGLRDTRRKIQTYRAEHVKQFSHRYLSYLYISVASVIRWCPTTALLDSWNSFHTSTAELQSGNCVE